MVAAENECCLRSLNSSYSEFQTVVEFYPQIKLLHVSTVLLTLSLIHI